MSCETYKFNFLNLLFPSFIVFNKLCTANDKTNLFITTSISLIIYIILFIIFINYTILAIIFIVMILVNITALVFIYIQKPEISISTNNLSNNSLNNLSNNKNIIFQVYDEPVNPNYQVNMPTL